MEYRWLVQKQAEDKQWYEGYHIRLQCKTKERVTWDDVPGIKSYISSHEVVGRIFKKTVRRKLDVVHDKIVAEKERLWKEFVITQSLSNTVSTPYTPVQS